MADIVESTVNQFEKDLDNILGTLARIYAHNGDTKSVAILTIADYSTEIMGGYSSDGVWVNEHTLTLKLPLPVYSVIKTDLKKIEDSFLNELNELVKQYRNDYIGNVNIVIQIVEDSNWKEKARIWLEGGKINNQGKVRSDNIASRIFDGLLFRSQAEINLYKALKKLGVSFAPLPVFVRGGDSYKRIEPDFLIIKDGVIMVVEVDGDTVHTETPAEAHNRTTMLLHEGVAFERFKASECETEGKAEITAKKILAILLKIKGNK